jgi:DNA segregation ATPase FtsK/SpoIIIE, S-DNA-T family
MSPSNERRRMLQEQRLKHRLEIQSRQIEKVLDRHDMPAQVSGGYVAPRSISYDLQSHLATGWERLRDLTSELKVALGVPDVMVSREGGRLRLEVGRTDEPPVSLLDLLAMNPDVPPLTATLGLSENGRPVLLRFDAQNAPHVLLSGAAGAGKTVLLRTMILSLALTNRRSRAQLLVIDPQVDDRQPDVQALEPLNFLPHMLTDVVYEMETAVEALNFLVGEVAYRADKEVLSPAMIVLIDRAAALLETGGAPVMDAITHLAQRGHRAGVHLILSTQRPGAAVFDAVLRGSLPVRVVGKVNDAATARAAAGLPDTEAENFLGKGDFVLVTGQKQRYFQAALVGDYDLHMCLQQLRRPNTPALLAHPYLIRPHLVDEAVDKGGQKRPFAFSESDDWPLDNEDQANK